MGFFIGMALAGLGFMFVWKTNWFLQWFGDIGEAFGAVGAPWLSWKLFGVILLISGIFIAFGLFQAIVAVTLGRFFTFGQLQ